jgi:hypothetical protein
MRWSLAFSVVLLAIAPTAAHADETTDREAAIRYKEGIKLADAKQYENAYLKFIQAYGLKRSPVVLANLASTEAATGRLMDAANHYRQVAAWGEYPKLTAQTRADAQKSADNLSPKVALIRVNLPQGAVLFIDGRDVPKEQPLMEPIAVTPGKHELTAQSGDEGTKHADVEAVVGDTRVVRLMASAPAASSSAPPAASSSASVVVVPLAPSASSAPNGDRPGPGRSTAQVVTTMSLVGVAALALGGGILLGSISADKADAAESLRNGLGPSGCSAVGACAELRDATDSRNTNATLSWVFYGTAGVAALGAVATWFFWPSSSAKSAVVVTPHVTPDGAGVGTFIRF